MFVRQILSQCAPNPFGHATPQLTATALSAWAELGQIGRETAHSDLIDTSENEVCGA
jgi:hypothetical protein